MRVLINTISIKLFKCSFRQEHLHLFFSHFITLLLLLLFQAFASQCLYCVRYLGIPIDRVNPSGGAIALGHPLGCSGRVTIIFININIDITMA
jgi:Thiolase, C-terminal domain